MVQPEIMQGAEPFFFEGSDIGVLVSHGFTGTTQSMRFLGEFLARDGGYTVIGPRLTGHGTIPEDMAKATAEDWIRDLETAVQTLQKTCKKIFMTGLSMGGTLTLYMAGRYPEVFAGIIPINAAVFVNSPDMAGIAYAPNAPEFLPGIGSDIKQPGITELAYPKTPVKAIRQLYVLMGVAHDLLPRITCPALVFSSRDDHVVPPMNGPYILEHIASEEKEIIWLDECYHVATLDNQKELIADETVRFIEEHC